MARIYSPREITKDGVATGLYHMTVHSDEERWCYAVGPCAESCPGHATAAEALAHWQEGQLKKAQFNGFDENLQKKCAICAKWTQKAAVIPGEFLEDFPLCDEHLNAESLRQVYLKPPVPMSVTKT